MWRGQVPGPCLALGAVLPSGAWFPSPGLSVILSCRKIADSLVKQFLQASIGLNSEIFLIRTFLKFMLLLHIIC